ncbi:unnamed protein product [Alternaria sp. RS040]
MSRTTFKHIPLARPAEQIRLLKLQPDTDALRLDLLTYELKESPEYVALSYEWGDGSEIHDIIINGAVFKIRQNLHDALEHIRTLQADTSSKRLFKEDSPYFWIDAVTIDQLNDKEKTDQVCIMGNIFHQASHVIAWLGLEQSGDNSALAMEYLNSSPEVLGDHQKHCPDSVTISAEENAVKVLCDRSYFLRIWIIQECVLAKKLDLLCGFNYCSWRHLWKFINFLHYKRRSSQSWSLLGKKSYLEKHQNVLSMRQTMVHMLEAAIDRHCSRFHDRIYGLLGVLQQRFQTTGMQVDYGASLEELMIKTNEFLTNDHEYDNSSTFASRILSIFKQVASVDVRGKVAWYWQIIEIMYKLDADVIKGFDSLETLRSEKERALIFQTICWIVGGYGVDLFSPVEGSTPLHTTTTIQTISFQFRENKETWWSDNRVFTMHSRCTIGIYTYCICLTNHPHGLYGLPGDFTMTGSIPWECRTLLEAYSKHVRFLGILRENFETSTEVSALEKPSPLPIRIQWMVFSNLLAQYFLSKYSWELWDDRSCRIDGFVRQIEREGKDLGTFLSESLFNKYHVSLASTSDELPANALKSVEIEITSSSDADVNSESVKKTLVASLYDNDSSEADWEDYCGTESSEDEE